MIQEAKQKLDKEVPRVFTPLAPNEVYTHDFEYSSRRASQKIGYKPKRELAEGVSELFDYALRLDKKPSG